MTGRELKPALGLSRCWSFRTEDAAEEFPLPDPEKPEKDLRVYLERRVMPSYDGLATPCRLLRLPKRSSCTCHGQLTDGARVWSHEPLLKQKWTSRPEALNPEKKKPECCFLQPEKRSLKPESQNPKSATPKPLRPPTPKRKTLNPKPPTPKPLNSLNSQRNYYTVNPLTQALSRNAEPPSKTPTNQTQYPKRNPKL